MRKLLLFIFLFLCFQSVKSQSCAHNTFSPSKTIAGSIRDLTIDLIVVNNNLSTDRDPKTTKLQRDCSVYIRSWNMTFDLHCSPNICGSLVLEDGNVVIHCDGCSITGQCIHLPECCYDEIPCN